jgi:hypothetical protein
MLIALNVRMLWQPIVISLVIALLITVPLVALLGWRRPRAPDEESGVLSAVFMFTLLFLALWASAAWMTPWGPELWGVSWVGLMVIGFVVALMMLAASWRPGSREPSYAGMDLGARVKAEEAQMKSAEGFGLMFWVLVSILLIAAVFGSY